MPARPLRLFNTLTRDVANFESRNPPHVGMYSCGPTVYAYQHIGNLRAYVFADTLKRTLRWKGYHVHHVINITDVGHLTSDADVGDDKLELAARREQPVRSGRSPSTTPRPSRGRGRLRIRSSPSVAQGDRPRRADDRSSPRRSTKPAGATRCRSGLYFDTSRTTTTASSPASTSRASSRGAGRGRGGQAQPQLTSRCGARRAGREPADGAGTRRGGGARRAGISSAR